MEFKRFEALIEKFPQVQIFSTEGADLDRVITHFLSQREKVSTMSETIQRKIQQALAPFFQQRFISLHDDEALLVRNLLLNKKFFLQTDRYIEDMAWPETDPEKLDEALKIADLAEGILDRKLLSLSNGELRRVLLARMWMENPEWIYFNDLFGGLDPEYRAHLAGCVAELARSRGTGLKIAVRLAREDELLPEIPAFVYADKTFVQYEGELPKEAAKPKYTKAELKDYEIVELRSEASDSKSEDAEILFDLKNINVRFGETDVLKNLNWTVRKGEHWAVMGENGAGKSTLLGMLTADHPQIYNNDITLLGERPGHGLNIWDHKAKLGFFSPELALQYREDLTLLEVLCTGFTPNLCRAANPTWEEKAKAREWLTYLGFEDVNQNIRSLSPIDKRLVLMARAAIRPPEVLLLDEPSQGLKGEYREKLFHLLQLLSTETTLILVSHYEEEWPPCMTHLLRMPKFSLG
ncbi:molybdate transport system ATP-binding protein [Fibrobacter sp. UWH9]|uniref:ATP-binding cassette domain-containing protein n=1 Tax=unclassified Fibrobacter TaxID=2634177 RepID=UPI00090EE3A0|nr:MULTISPECIES: ATP-binding cassette domain-containing protein [Fibrobacter]MCQ2099947.1 ATP-binding cassette domain-containing protein [Fibrobacter sp.]MCL4102144.1 Vitamin B12 import ATP-binding protein BtuD [Fibrobacter succinogenes]OWV04771.1 ABC transporter [Fibrobacter sp. UWH3]OWV13852.1 ABC transporter [Fibrobacter sp. UWH1]SHG67463.1 molybdate transport system ATP-binding protein [Fibrobacter sp. UWH9]